MPPTPPARRVKAQRTPEQRAEGTVIHRQFQAKESIQGLVDQGEITEELAQHMRQQLAEGPPLVNLQSLMEQLRAERLRLSLADLADRTGMDRAALHRLETGQNRNPTLATVDRYARALGKRLAWVVENDEPVRAS